MSTGTDNQVGLQREGWWAVDENTPQRPIIQPAHAKNLRSIAEKSESISLVIITRSCLLFYTRRIFTIHTIIEIEPHEQFVRSPTSPLSLNQDKRYLPIHTASSLPSYNASSSWPNNQHQKDAKRWELIRRTCVHTLIRIS